jgi:hypothetical protein
MTKCYIYHDGNTIPAKASRPFKDYANREVVRISANDKSIVMRVNASLAKARLANDEQPVFYAM